MVFSRKFAEGLANIFRRGRLLYAENFVIFFFGSGRHDLIFSLGSRSRERHTLQQTTRPAGIPSQKPYKKQPATKKPPQASLPGPTKRTTIVPSTVQAIAVIGIVNAPTSKPGAITPAF
jgi:hypothetical protein